MVKSGKYIEITFVTVSRSIDFVIGGIYPKQLLYI